MNVNIVWDAETIDDLIRLVDVANDLHKKTGVNQVNLHVTKIMHNKKSSLLWIKRLFKGDK